MEADAYTRIPRSASTLCDDRNWRFGLQPRSETCVYQDIYYKAALSAAAAAVAVEGASERAHGSLAVSLESVHECRRLAVYLSLALWFTSLG